MEVIKWIFKTAAKLVVLPFALCFWAIKYLFLFACSVTDWFFSLAATGLFSLGLVLLAFQTASFKEILPLWIVSFIMFIIPYAGEWIMGVCDHISQQLGSFIRS